MKNGIIFINFILSSLILISCSSSKNLKTSENSHEAAPIVVEDSASVFIRKDLDTAHESFLRALLMMQKNEPAIAELFLRRALDADPTSRYLAFTLAEVLNERGNFEEALRVAQQANEIKGSPNSTEYALLASLYRQMIHVDSAKHYYRKSIEMSDYNLSALYEYSLLLEIIKDKEELIRVYGLLLPNIGYSRSLLNRQITLLDEMGKDSLLLSLFQDVYAVQGDPVYYYAYLEKLMKLKRYEEVLSGVEKLYLQNSIDTAAVLFETQAFLNLNLVPQALDSLHKRYLLGAQTSLILKSLALLELDLERLDSAKVHFKGLVQDTLYAGLAHYNLAKIAQIENDTLASIREIEAAAAWSPKYLYTQAYTYFYYSDYSKVYPVLDSLSKIQNEVIHVFTEKEVNNSKDSLLRQQVIQKAVADEIKNKHLYALSLLFEARKFDAVFDKKSAYEARIKADTLLKNLLQNDSLSNSESFLYRYGANLERLGKIDESMNIFREIVKRNPKNASAWNYLGYTLVDLNRSPEELAEGVVFIDHAILLDDTNASFIDSKAWALYRQGYYQEALQWMEKINPEEMSDDEVYWKHLALICEALGYMDRAIKYYEIILQLNPNHSQVKKRLKELKADSP